MASVYDQVSGWVNSITYSKYNIVTGSDQKYYYSLIDNNFNNNPALSPSLQNTWDGYILINSSLVPNFFWKPSYQSNSKIEPKVKKIQFGNGYQQRVTDSLNYELKNINLNFDNRTEIETVSILHFFEERGGKQSFVYNVPTIYSKTSNVSRFVASSWQVTYNFYNNYSINSTFEEVPA